MDTTLTILKICAVIGLFDTAYLIWHKLQGTDVACIGFPKEWCQKVQYSRQSRTIGVSNSIWGFLMYAAILLFVLLQAYMPFWPIEVLVAIGFVFAAYFTVCAGFSASCFLHLVCHIRTEFHCDVLGGICAVKYRLRQLAAFSVLAMLVGLLFFYDQKRQQKGAAQGEGGIG